MLSTPLTALAIDTSSDWLSLALLVNDEPVASVYSRQRTRVNRILFTELDTLLQGAGLELRGLDLLVVARGPGSFTGTRLGLAVAQTFAAVTGIPLIGVDTLALLAAQTDSTTPGLVHAVLNCAREEVYHAPFRWVDGRIEAQGPLRLREIGSLADELGEVSASAQVVLRRFPQRGAARPEVEAQFARLHAFSREQTLPLRHPVPDGQRLLSVGVARYRHHLANAGGSPLPPAEPVYLKSEAFRKWQHTVQKPVQSASQSTAQHTMQKTEPEPA